MQTTQQRIPGYTSAIDPCELDLQHALQILSVSNFTPHFLKSSRHYPSAILSKFANVGARPSAGKAHQLSAYFLLLLKSVLTDGRPLPGAVTEMSPHRNPSRHATQLRFAVRYEIDFLKNDRSILAQKKVRVMPLHILKLTIVPV
ncbi:MAG TPA: hypothetical protein VJZ27_20160 [Aggregatilineales bacterium]|nr:hypothetical protein [Aggregatilineales bacterium]